jgi:hypothetical protein
VPLVDEGFVIVPQAGDVAASSAPAIVGGQSVGNHHPDFRGVALPVPNLPSFVTPSPFPGDFLAVAD